MMTTTKKVILGSTIAIILTLVGKTVVPVHSDNGPNIQLLDKVKYTVPMFYSQVCNGEGIVLGLKNDKYVIMTNPRLKLCPDRLELERDKLKLLKRYSPKPNVEQNQEVRKTADV